ncbi:YheC/YheD family endospore coat-associated protein [Candidatus Contubernalis alkaliaceticus]|uniref:YheC/YheD family endospore coat-associated protein n=1 Tax=Candidatus Contubernalis alkaliaceticus TaxID=338645 RepID=UPI001F4C48A4|nr:YheC/YheD family protein [Candidatus Contubernalis alkalaceticus]UNC91918.1 YheC/YheD family protein [Candidatus Contubernalis alkalaceticus]
MNDCPLIGIHVSKRKYRKRILKLYGRYHGLNLKLFSFTSSDILWKEQGIIGLHLVGNKCKESILPFPQAVYNRCYNKRIKKIKRLENIIGWNKCFNVINFFNKWHVYNLLNQSKLKRHLPDTFIYDEVNVSELLKKYKLVYIKPFYGNKGKRVYRVELTDNGDIHISSHSTAPRYICRKNEDVQKILRKLLQGKKFIVQKGIRSRQIDNQYCDIRVLVQKDILGKWAISTKTIKIAYEHFFNTSIYETIYEAEKLIPNLIPKNTEKSKILRSLNKISKNAAKVLDTHMGPLGELSVDFIIDEDGKLWITEINGKPQKSIYKDIKNFKDKQLIYRRPMEYAYYLSQILI